MHTLRPRFLCVIFSISLPLSYSLSLALFPLITPMLLSAPRRQQRWSVGTRSVWRSAVVVPPPAGGAARYVTMNLKVLNDRLALFPV